MGNFKSAIEKVFINEGGYANYAKDSGGETKYGITKRTYPDVDIKNLTLSQAEDIYRKDFWDKIKGDDIADDNVAYEIFDTAVNMGARTSSKLAQMVTGSHPDGFIGSKTLNDLNGINVELFVSKFQVLKVARYIYLVKKYPKNRKFFFGWINRTLGG